MTDTNMDHLRTWIGREETRCDIITPELTRRFCATLALDCTVPEGHVTAEVTMDECAFDNRAKNLLATRDRSSSEGGRSRQRPFLCSFRP